MAYDPQSPEAIIGAWAERYIIERAIARGWHVLHTAEVRRGAAMVEGRDGKVVMPDLQLFDLLRGRGSRLVEVKIKRGAYRFMKEQLDCTGVDRPNWQAYLRMRSSGVFVDLALIHLRWPLRTSAIAPRLLWQTVDRLNDPGPMPFDHPAFKRGAVVWDIGEFQHLGTLPYPPPDILAAANALGARLRLWEKPGTLRLPAARPRQYRLDL